jgi:mannose-6-phosphate isomerase-like protein (cupin superfamily)
MKGNPGERDGQRGSVRRLVLREQDVVPREFEWGEARRFISVTGLDWACYLSEGTIATEGLSLGRATVSPCGEKPPSVHQEEEEAYLILKGTGICTIGDEDIPVGPGSVVYIPAGVHHGLANTGAEPLEYVFALGFRRPI